MVIIYINLFILKYYLERHTKTIVILWIFFRFLDEFTKDETVASGEDTSMKADFILDLRS